MMITKLEELKPGTKVFHAYPVDKPFIREVTIQSLPISYKEECIRSGIKNPKIQNMKGMGMWFGVADDKGNVRVQSAMDIGIGANHNNNRFFTTREEAEAHIAS